MPKLESIGNEIFLYADDTTIIVTSPNLVKFETQTDKIFGDIIRDYDLKLNYQGNYIKSSSNTKFWGLIIADSLSSKAHTDHMMSKMNTAYFVIRTIQAIMSPETLRMVYFA